MSAAHNDEIDRTVHAVCADGREIVRYNRAGKWWIEHASGRVPLRLQSAAEIAAVATTLGGEVRFGLPGGTAFDKRVRDYLTDRSTRPAGGES